MDRTFIEQSLRNQYLNFWIPGHFHSLTFGFVMTNCKKYALICLGFVSPPPQRQTEENEFTFINIKAVYFFSAGTFWILKL